MRDPNYPDYYDKRERGEIKLEPLWATPKISWVAIAVLVFLALALLGVCILPYFL